MNSQVLHQFVRNVFESYPDLDALWLKIKKDDGSEVYRLYAKVQSFIVEVWDIVQYPGPGELTVGEVELPELSTAMIVRPTPETVQ